MNFTSLALEEIRRVIAYIPTAAYIAIIREPGPDPVVAGGLVRDVFAGLEPKDVDIFCHSEEQAERLAFQAANGKPERVRKTTFAYSVLGLSLPVQFIFYKEFATVEELVGQFDFRACCAGMRFRDDSAHGGHAGAFGWEGIAVDGFREDCRDKVLRFMSQDKDRDKLTALRRALNFAAKGWKIENEEVGKILTHFDTRLTLEPERVARAFKPAYGR
jgi:hypothetical protein